jgi:hypothetical protein
MKVPCAWAVALLLAGCAGGQGPDPAVLRPAAGATPDKLMVVDCLLPGMLVNQGQFHQWMTPPQPTRATAQQCEIRGGQYVAYDRANYATALSVWREAADGGDPAAQTYVGEIYEKGLGIPPDHARAATWYQKAADQGYARALTNLAYLYEKGLGVEKNPQKAFELHRRAVGLPPTIALAGAASPEELRALRQQLESAYRKLQETEGELRRVQAAAAQKEEEVKRLEDELKKLRGSSQVDKAALRKAEDELTRSRQDLERSKARAADAEEQVRKYRDTIANYDKKVPRASSTALRGLDLGSYHAVVIGNDKYQNHPVLRTAASDARAVAEVLKGDYGFKVQLLIDANYATMVQALFDTANRLGEHDNLLIYFAGHGQLLKEISRGYWLPVDATKEVGATWVSTQQIDDIVSISKAKHILVVVDSCFAGALVRGVEEMPMPASSGDPDAMTEYVRRLAQAKSRHALTSGGLTPVLDTASAARATHSIFARALLDVLGNNKELLSGHAVWQKLAPRVTAAASRVMSDPQKPEYSAMFGPGHDSGEFFLAPSVRSAAGSSVFASR